MTRNPNWEQLLADFIHERHSMPFKWGSNDCCMFASDWALLATGVDPAKDFRGYKSKIAAERILAGQGVADVGGLVDKVCGAYLVGKPLLMANRGDWVLGQRGEGIALGICVGAHCAFVGPRGLEFLALLECLKAYKI
jgi:hypothetical protein